MPHDVIMPALGMAQDTGLLVSWTKALGDAVAATDVLFEVETDKSTMEVEAGADGYLVDMRAEAGQDVPVGQVIAIIADSPDAVVDSSPAAAPAAATAPAKIEGAEVIMPALGMAQDTGLIVAWRKAPGEAVAATDVLFEVETDKSTVEVEAGHDGFLAAVYAQAGEEAPVGDVIAVISADKPENPVSASIAAGAAAKPSTVEPSAPAPQPAPASAKPAAPKPAVIASGGKVLASPKAKRLAAEEGLDLGLLVKDGAPQPYHVADLDRLRALAAAKPAPAAGAAPCQITAEAPAEAFDAFMALAGDASPKAVRASFAAGALREATGAAALTIRAGAPGRGVVYADPDRTRASAIAPAEDQEATPDLILRDLSGGAITGMTLAGDPAPALAVGRSGDRFTLTLTFTAGQLDADAAIALVTGFAARLNDPLRHLL